jgi:DNA mismatch repair ATPase MutL
MDCLLEMVEKKINFSQVESFMNSAASKACRTAVMVGDVLSKREMSTIVYKLA